MGNNFNAFLKIPVDEQDKYKGKYIVMIDGKIVDSGEEIDKILPKIIEKYPNKIPFVAKIPTVGTMVL